jgi:hypothetical protein
MKSQKSAPNLENRIQNKLTVKHKKRRRKVSSRSNNSHILGSNEERKMHSKTPDAKK